MPACSRYRRASSRLRMRSSVVSASNTAGPPGPAAVVTRVGALSRLISMLAFELFSFFSSSSFPRCP